MKIYIKPEHQDPKDKSLEELLKNLEVTADKDLSDEALDQMLAEAKEEYDEAWMQEAECHIPMGMEMRLQATIDALALKEDEVGLTVQPELCITPEQAKIPPRHNSLWMRATACAAILLSLGVGLNLYASNNAFVDTCKTPEEAQMQLERALAILSENGDKAIHKANESFNDAALTQQVLSKYITIQ